VKGSSFRGTGRNQPGWVLISSQLVEPTWTHDEERSPESQVTSPRVKTQQAQACALSQVHEKQLIVIFGAYVLFLSHLLTKELSFPLRGMASKFQCFICTFLSSYFEYGLIAFPPRPTVPNASSFGYGFVTCNTRMLWRSTTSSRTCTSKPESRTHVHSPPLAHSSLNAFLPPRHAHPRRVTYPNSRPSCRRSLYTTGYHTNQLVWTITKLGVRLYRNPVRIPPTRTSIPYIPFFSLLHLYRTHSHLYSFRSIHYLVTPEIQGQTHIRHFHIDAHEPAMDNWYPQSHIATLSEYEDVAVASNLRGSRPRTLWRRARGAAKGSTGASNTAAPAEKVNVDELRPRVGWTWSI